MRRSGIVCSRCRQYAAPGTHYCAHCGEPVDPKVVAEVRWLYKALFDLDGRIKAGRGSQTVEELREEYRERYLALRTDPASARTAKEATAAASVSAPEQASAITAPVAPVDVPGALPANGDRHGGAARATGPAFSWQAFLAEQAIAIMSYLGGFLLLVATTSFEVGGWQVLPNLVKLAVVCIVYLVFGVLGFALRRWPRLRTVGRTYLGVFALMTPLVALAVYRFELQASGFSSSGMLCLGALYATVVYLTLGHTTRFSTYVYLGWGMLIIAALSIVPWSNAPTEWWVFALAVVALVLLLPRLVSQFDIAARLGPAATQISVIASLVTAVSAEALVVLALVNALAVSGTAPAVSTLAAAAAACALVPLAAGWSFTLRAMSRSNIGSLIEVVEVLGAVWAAQAAVAVAVWLGATPDPLAYVLAVLAVIELTAAVTLRRVHPARIGTRRALEGLALALASFGWLLAASTGGLTQPLVATLTACVLVGTGITLLENAPWWLLSAGLFLTLDNQAIGTAILPPSHLASDSSGAYAALVLALWLVGLGLGLTAGTRRFAIPVFVVAVGDAIYASILLVAHPDSVFQTVVLLAFAVAAFIAALRERRLLDGSMVAGVFGLLAALPFALDDTTGWHASLLAVALALAALAVRRAFGLRWALAPYSAALVASVLAIVGAGANGVSTAGWELLGVPWAAWVALAIGVLSAVAAWCEAWPWTMAIPAAFALWAVVLTGDHAANVVLVFCIAATGVGIRQRRGRWWGTAFYASAVCGSAVVVIALSDLGAAAPYWQVPLLLGYGLAAYLVAVYERQPWMTAVAAVYAVVAVSLLPGTDNFVPTVALTFGLAALGVALRFILRGLAGRGWTPALYAAAVGASIFAVLRVTPYDAGAVEALLLVFAGAAYVIALLEAAPLAGMIPIAYAAAAVRVQPDAHALLPLAIGLAVGGLVAGRLARIRWSYPFYAASAVAAAATGMLGQPDASFDALALLALALVAYVIAAVESRPDVLPLALALGVLAVAAGSSALGLTSWQTTLAFAALGWLYILGGALWRALPGLRPTGPIWWTAGVEDDAQKVRWCDPRFAGAQVHRWAAILVGAGVVVGALLEPASFIPHTAQTQVVALALVSFAGMLALLGREAPFRLALYAAGALAALAISWEARWLGADNIQAFILAPGSYQLLIGAVLPTDRRVARGVPLGLAASLAGVFLLLAPTLVQSYQTDPNWLYTLVLALEALVIAGAGVGTRSRPLVLVGAAFVVLAAVRGAALAVQSGLPIPVVIGIVAVLLLGGATWLSLRTRREATHRT